ncbi:MarR family winged helix-turn-helix transcriptional regulator [Nocardia bovistercoris]|uniref:Winged helix-turn-helix transcriptional regulator n=1 Tax=Nocardia bovistercoris TaxID=2785916 RepID=A0A931N7K5_9NOCA|nr:MarR family winged helix-turn-helix transcriptional regulator [Nocardia bovistercoris]MBH0781716.1 winged helix-turn-helix transcriptional regulator [Nocardia bovistercoris]
MKKINTVVALAVIAITVATACATTSDTGGNTAANPSEPTAPTLTGQDIGEANGALDALLEDALADTGVTIREYLVLRTLGRQSPRPARDFYDYLVGQRQLKLDASTAVDTVRGLEDRGLVTGVDPEATALTLTPEGVDLDAALAARAAPIATQVFGEMNPTDLQTAHRVLRDIIDRSRALRASR